MSTMGSTATFAKLNGKTEGITAREFFNKKIPGMGLNDAHFATHISRSTLDRYMRTLNARMKVETAKKLQKWSKGAISAARTVGL